MSKKQAALVSDFDGVWADSFVPLTELNQKAFAAIGRVITPEDHRSWYIRGIKRSKRELLTDEKEYQAMLAVFNRYNEEYYRRVRVFPWAKEILPTVSKVASIVIASSSKDHLIQELLDREELSKYFIAILGAADLSKIAMFEKALGILGTKAHETFFLTDTVGDVQEAKEFGFRTIAVTWGFHDRKILESVRPDVIINDPAELVSIFHS